MLVALDLSDGQHIGAQGEMHSALHAWRAVQPSHDQGCRCDLAKANTKDVTISKKMAIRIICLRHGWVCPPSVLCMQFAGQSSEHGDRPVGPVTYLAILRGHDLRQDHSCW